jgi:hypothetical protein
VQEGFTDSADVSVLVYYTHQALESIPDLLDAIDLDFIDTNQAFANSGVQASVSIAAKIAVDESPISGSLAFEELTEKKGPFTNVDEVRAKYQADLVHFYPKRLHDACGTAYYAAFRDGGAERNLGFGVTKANCTGNLTTAHELGHNFGAAHDRYVEGGGTDAANYGYVDLDNQFITIMSYTDKCDDNDVDCEYITHFSNPDKTYNEFQTGLPEPISQATNNTAQLNYSGLTLANFFGVATPTISSVSQGDDQSGVQLEWTVIDNATSYRINRREASFNDFSGSLCSYPVFGVEFEVITNQFIDTTAIDGTTYCYSVVALNDPLLGETYSPESFVRTGYKGNDDSLVLPYIDNISLSIDTQNLQKTLTLPDTFDYQLFLVEHNLSTPPMVYLTAVAGNEYLLEVDDIVLTNQTITIGLEAIHKKSGITVAQLFNVFSSNIENQRPNVSVESNFEVGQLSSNKFVINVTDDQVVAEDGIYAYSRDEDLLGSIWVSEDENGQYILNIIHAGFKTGEAEIVVGYSDGEYLTEAVTTVKVNRTIFNPTQTQHVTWYVTPGESITRLLPFYDMDRGETLTVNLVSPPQNSQLDFVLRDKVTYTANTDFTDDSFSFIVTGEDDISTDEVIVTILPPPESKLSITQKLILSGENAAFLSHEGHLYTWGRNSSGEGDTLNNADTIYTPTKVEQQG